MRSFELMHHISNKQESEPCHLFNNNVNYIHETQLKFRIENKEIRIDKMLELTKCFVCECLFSIQNFGLGLPFCDAYYTRVYIIINQRAYEMSFQMLDTELFKPVKFRKFKKVLQPYFNQVMWTMKISSIFSRPYISTLAK